MMAARLLNHYSRNLSAPGSFQQVAMEHFLTFTYLHRLEKQILMPEKLFCCLELLILGEPSSGVF